MMTRRTFSLFAAGAAILPLTRVAESADATPPQGGSAAGFRYVEVVTGGKVAVETLPLVIALHGRGDSAENWARSWREIGFAARVVLPQGPVAYGEGFAWFDPPRAPGAPSDAELRKLVGDLTSLGDSLARFMAEVQKAHHPSSRPIVTGFSQGGSISFALAVKHGGDIAASLPIAGSPPPPMLPASGGGVAPVIAFHGEDDARLPIARARASVEALRRLGASAELRSYPQTGHEVSAAMWRDLQSTIAARAHAKTI